MQVSLALNNSITFEMILSCDDVSFLNVVKTIREIVITHHNATYEKESRWTKSKTSALTAILSNLYSLCKCSNIPWLSIELNSNFYSINNRYQKKYLSYKSLSTLITQLEELELIEVAKGFYDKEKGEGKLTRIQPTNRLLELFDNIEYHPTNFTSVFPKETIILKQTEGKQRIDYDDTEHTNAMRENVKIINEHTSKYHLNLKITDEQYDELSDRLQKDKDKPKPLNFNSNQLHRSFNNGSFEQGGRFYGGWWQNIPSIYRGAITISGKPTVEIDYSAIHFYLMYCEKGVTIPETDLYDFPSYERKKVKLVLNILLNASKLSLAKGAVTKQFPEMTEDDINRLIDLAYERHSPISEFFATGKGVELQYMDSQIAESVMLGMINNYGTICLPVHDSFIVRRTDRDFLEQQMKASFREIAGHDIDPEIKVTYVDSSLKSDMGELGLVNGADTFETYKNNQQNYTQYRHRENIKYDPLD